jgi:hypothetical protein
MDVITPQWSESSRLTLEERTGEPAENNLSHTIA